MLYTIYKKSPCRNKDFDYKFDFILFDILVRESGTEPVVRVMVEAPDHDTCQKYVDEVVNVICKKGYKV